MPEDKQQIKIGLTGGIGAGKTFIGKIFSKLGFPVFNSDVEAKRCMLEDEILKKKIQDLFGDEVYQNGVLQNHFLANIVFNDEKHLEHLNKLVHPLVKKKFEKWCKKNDSKIVIKEAAILFESNSHINLDKVICVSADKEIRIQRIIKRDNISREEVIARMSRQISQNEKERLSDFIIVNNGSQLLLPQIIKLINKID